MDLLIENPSIFVAGAFHSAAFNRHLGRVVDFSKAGVARLRPNASEILEHANDRGIR